MSSIDSGINSIATVVTTEIKRGETNPTTSHVRQGMWLTLAAGLFITTAAYLLNFMPEKWGIVGAMPRTFNAITAPLGGLFLIGMFLPRAGQRAAIIGALCGLVTSITLGYLEQFGNLFVNAGLLTQGPPAISFTWIMPSALLVTFTVAWFVSRFERPSGKSLAGLTWSRRHEQGPP
jgi:SSS family solute:Na+ symporter